MQQTYLAHALSIVHQNRDVPKVTAQIHDEIIDLASDCEKNLTKSEREFLQEYFDFGKLEKIYKALALQSYCLFGRRNFYATEAEICSFVTMPTRPHVAKETEIAADLYIASHDQRFGTKLGKWCKENELETMPLQHILWLTGKNRSLSWSAAKNTPQDLRKIILHDYGEHIKEDVQFLQSCSGEEIRTQFATGYDGKDKEFFNAQSIETIHVHNVVKRDQLPFAQMRKCTVEDRMKYLLHPYYFVTGKLHKEVSEILLRCLISEGMKGKVLCDIVENSPYEPVVFTIEDEHNWRIDHVLNFAIEFNGVLEDLWDVLAIPESECKSENAIFTDMLPEFRELVDCQKHSRVQRYPGKPGFNVSMEWSENGMIRSFSLAPSCYGPAERTNGAIVQLH